jgi:hypothetical protein
LKLSADPRNTVAGSFRAANQRGVAQLSERSTESQRAVGMERAKPERGSTETAGTMAQRIKISGDHPNVETACKSNPGSVNLPDEIRRHRRTNCARTREGRIGRREWMETAVEARVGVFARSSGTERSFGSSDPMID